jgi:hypothetical protein
MDSNMIKQVRNVAGSALLGATVLFTPAASALAMPGAPTDELYQVGQVGLVNVSIGNVTILKDVNIAVAANVVAQLCDVADANVGVLAQAIQQTGSSECKADAAGTALAGLPVIISR